MTKKSVGILLLCAVVGAVMFAVGTSIRQGEALGQVGGAAGDIIAVAIQYNSDFPVLFVLDAKAMKTK